MARREAVDIEALLHQISPVTEAIRRGAREAMKQYISADKPMVSWSEGKVVNIPPAELRKLLQG